MKEIRIIRRLQVRILRKDSFFKLLVLGSRRYGDSSPGFRRWQASGQIARKQLNIKTLGPQMSKHLN